MVRGGRIAEGQNGGGLGDENGGGEERWGFEELRRKGCRGPKPEQGLEVGGTGSRVWVGRRQD